MIFLAGSILFSAFLTIGFKICQRLGINTFHAIVFNYLTCVITGFVFGVSHPFNAGTVGKEWFPWAVILGCCFIVFFNLTALTVKRSGVAIAGVATKISLVIPFVFSLYYYGEGAGTLKWIGVMVALVSVILTCYQPGQATPKSLSPLLLLLPVLLFIGTGFQDTLIKFAEHGYLQPAELDAFLITCFVVAFSAGLILLIVSMAGGRVKLHRKAVLAGVCIGIPNYFSIWCLIKVLKLFPSNSSLIIPVNNIAIVLLNALAGYFLFREKLSRTNVTGIALAAVAIYLITGSGS